jgi:hypothetical protein
VGAGGAAAASAAAGLARPLGGGSGPITRGGRRLGPSARCCWRWFCSGCSWPSSTAAPGR